MRLKNPVWKSCPEIKRIYTALRGEARFVGGCVRDGVIGKAPADIDMATPLKPAAVMGILKKRGYTVLPTGFLYGTVTALTNNPRFPTIEITTLRRDIENDGRRPKVLYTKDWEQDALRRDFTFNALYADFNGEVFDYCGGIEDLKAGRVRFIGDPALRIAEDYLRVLRYFRFLSVLGRTDADDDTLAACGAAEKGVARISLDRTKRELFKLICAERAEIGLSAMNRAGVLEQYFPPERLPVFERLARAFPTAGLNARLPALGGVDADGVEKLVGRWQLSRVQRRDMLKFALFDRSKPPADYTDNDVFRFATCFDGCAAEALALFDADQPDRGWGGLETRVKSVVVPPFRFSGSDAAGFVDKKDIKAAVAKVREYWLSTGGTADRAALLDFFKSTLRR